MLRSAFQVVAPPRTNVPWPSLFTPCESVLPMLAVVSTLPETVNCLPAETDQNWFWATLRVEAMVADASAMMPPAFSVSVPPVRV